jgi:hypothetical protein
VLCWVIQVQLLLQIIINRIRIIVQDRTRGRQLTVGTAAVVTLINVSVFCIWIPARLQISQRCANTPFSHHKLIRVRWIRINTIWDRLEKVIYLLLDAFLNYYFIRVVDSSLVRHGLKKYIRLVQFNKRIIAVSLLMDVMIIGTMSVPNGFVLVLCLSIVSKSIVLTLIAVTLCSTRSPTFSSST